MPSSLQAMCFFASRAVQLATLGGAALEDPRGLTHASHGSSRAADQTLMGTEIIDSFR